MKKIYVICVISVLAHWSVTVPVPVVTRPVGSQVTQEISDTQTRVHTRVHNQSHAAPVDTQYETKQASDKNTGPGEKDTGEKKSFSDHVRSARTTQKVFTVDPKTRAVQQVAHTPGELSGVTFKIGSPERELSDITGDAACDKARQEVCAKCVIIIKTLCDNFYQALSWCYNALLSAL